MNYYKDNNGNVYAYDDEAIADIINVDEEGNETITKSPWIEGKTKMTAEEIELHINPPKSLDELKAQKMQELKKAKDEAQSQPVLVRDLYFFGGRDNGQKYKEAFDLAKMLGKTTGTVAHTAGMVEIDEVYITEILTAIGLASYQAWYKLQQLNALVNSATTKEEIGAVKW